MSKLLTVFLILTIFSINLFLPKTGAAFEECKGVVTDQSANLLADVQIELYTGGLSMQPQKQITNTASDGKYIFRVNGFANTSLGIAKIIFTKENFQEYFIDYSRGGSCPGNITLNSVNLSGYICNKGVCDVVSQNANSQFSSETQCKSDCGVYRYDARDYCVPDANGTIYSLKECQNKTPVTSRNKYKYNSLNNNCVQDDNGELLEDCQKQIKSSFSKQCQPGDKSCTSAAGKACEGGQAGVLTAIGCIPTEPTAFVQSFIKVAIGAGGGIALLLMIYGAFQMITSSGNPDGVKKGHEQITSAVIGLLFIIFAVMLLKIIGVDILQIPGFKP